MFFGWESHCRLQQIPQLISQFELNHKRALVSYLNAKGYKVTEDGNRVAGTRNADTIQATFDALSRLTLLNG
jgi:hypothetical protein